MNKIYVLLVMALTIALLVLWKTNEETEKEPFWVTYHVATHTQYDHRMIVTYTDAKGVSVEVITDTSWDKMVCLPSDGIASLRIDEIPEPRYDIHLYMYQKLQIHDSIAKNFTMHPLSIWIEHERKTVLSAGYKHLQVSLLKSEID